MRISLLISCTHWVCFEPFAFFPSSALLLSAAGSNSTNNLNTLIDLAGLDVSSAPPPPLPPRSLAAAPSAAPGPAEIPVLPPPPQAFVPPRSSSAGQGETAPAQQGSTTNSLSLLDEELLCLGKMLRGLQKGCSVHPKKGYFCVLRVPGFQGTLPCIILSISPCQ